MKTYQLLLFFLLSPLVLLAQVNEYAMGSTQDDASYALIPTKPKLLTRSYSTLPSFVSLERYCPTPASQGSYGTCTSWAVAYAARTIMEAIGLGCTNPQDNAIRAFSPSYVYAHIKNADDYNCQKGSAISDALQLLCKKGVPRKSTFYADCAQSVTWQAEDEAPQYRIRDYFTLFSLDATDARKIESTKMALSQGRPVIIAMMCYSSFDNAGRIWNGITDNFRGYHAMCVVGYDDNIGGGAFRIMNSWGTYWGEGGFTWVRYSDYVKYVRYAFEMYLNSEQPSAPKLSGSLKVRLNSGSDMPLRIAQADGCCVYKVLHSYPSGTQYRVLISNDAPAYVYLIGSDLSCRSDILFPPSPQVSPALVYKANDIAVPDEQWDIRTDNTVGTDYLCVLYSHSALDINTITNRIANLDGTFPQRVSKALGSQAIPYKDISFNNSEVRFSSASNNTVVPIVIEIPHSR